MERDERCDYPFHPIHEDNRVKTERQGASTVYTYRCPVCEAEAWSSISDEIPGPFRPSAKVRGEA